jgi:hypothetical protein
VLLQGGKATAGLEEMREAGDIGNKSRRRGGSRWLAQPRLGAADGGLAALRAAEQGEAGPHAVGSWAR